MSVVAFDRRRLRELRAEIAVWPELTEKGLAQRLRVLLRIWVRLLDLRRAAFDVVARQFHWHLGGEAEGDEEGGIVDVNVHRLLVSVDWLGERQREVKRKQPLVVVERIVLRGFEWKIFVLPDMHEAEVVEIFERVDVHVGEWLQLLCREDAVTILVEALHRHGRVEVIERPRVTHAGDLVIVIQEDFRAHGGPDMRVGSGRRGAQESDGRTKTVRITMFSQRPVPRISS